MRLVLETRLLVLSLVVIFASLLAVVYAQNVTCIGLPQWSIWKSSTSGPYVSWHVCFNITGSWSLSRYWVVDEYGGGSQPKSAYLLTIRNETLSYSIYGYAVNMTILAVNSTTVLLDLYRNITAVFDKITAGLIPEPHATWLKSNMTVVYLKLDYLGDKVPIAIKYSLDGGVTWNDITASRVAKIVDVDDPSNTTPVWFFDPTTNILAIRIPLNKTTGRAILEVKLGHASVSATVQPDKTDIYIGDIVNIKITITSKNVTYPVQATVICVPHGESIIFEVVRQYFASQTLNIQYRSTIAYVNKSLVNTTFTFKALMLLPTGSFDCYVWASKQLITSFTVNVKSYTDQLYWSVPSGTIELTPNDAVFFHLMDFYFTGKSPYSNVTVILNSVFTWWYGENSVNNTVLLVAWSIYPEALTESAYTRVTWGTTPIVAQIFGKKHDGSILLFYRYIPTENKYYPYRFWFDIWNYHEVDIYYQDIGYIFGASLWMRMGAVDEGYRLIGNVFRVSQATFYARGTTSILAMFKVGQIIGPNTYLWSWYKTWNKFLLGWGSPWRNVAFVGTIGSVAILRGEYTGYMLEAITRYHVIPWSKVVFLVDPTLFKRSDRTVPIVSARGYSGYAVIGSDVKVLLTTRFFVYIFKGFANDGLPHILIPPGVCIRIWNETFSYTYCNPGTYPWIDGAEIMPLAPGRYHWALGEADVVDLAFLPRSLLYTGGQAVQVKTVTSLLYPSAPVRTPSNLTVIGGGSGLEVTEVAHSYATSLLIQTPIYDLSNVKKLSLQFTFTLKPYVRPRSNMIPIVIVERSGQDLSDYPVKIVLNSSNFKAWDAVTCDRVWNPDTCNFWFTDSEGNLLYYWVEYFNKTVPLAVIWVKVPKIPARGITVIEMHWGTTNPASTYLNPSAVTLLFDEFNTLSNWNYNPSYVSLSSGVVVLNEPVGGAYLRSKVQIPNLNVRVIVRWSFNDHTGPNEGVDIGLPTSTPGSDCVYTNPPKYYVLFAPESENLYHIWVHRYNWVLIYSKSFAVPSNVFLVSDIVVYKYDGKVYGRERIYKYLYEGPIFDSGPVDLGTYEYQIGYLGFREMKGKVDFVAVLKYIYPEPAVYVNRTFAEFDLGFTSSGTVSSSSPRLVVVGRVGVENATYVVYGSSWSSPVMSGGGLVGVPVSVNVTWVSPSSVGDVTVRFSVGAYTFTWSGSYTMSGGLYLWVGFGSGLAYANVSVVNVTLTYSDTQNNTYSYRLTFSSTNLAMWSSGGGHVIALRAVFFPYSILVAFMANTSDYTIAEAISQSTLSTVTRMSLASWGLAYYGVDRGVWVFASEKLFPVTPGLIYLKQVFPLAGYVEGSCLVVNVPSSSVRNAVLLMAYASGAVTLRVDGSVSSGGSVEAYYMVPGTIRRVEKFSLGRDVFVDYYVTSTPVLVYVRWRSAQVSRVELCATGQLTPLSLPLRVGFNSTLIAYVPAVLAVFNLTSNSIVDAGRVKNLVVELRDPSTASVLGTYRLTDINLIISPAPSLVLFTFNGTLFLDLSVLSGETIDAVPASLNPVAPIKLYVTVDRAHYESWRQPLYILLLYDTGVAKVAISSAYGFGAVTGSGDLIYYGFTLDVPQYLLGDYGELLVESVPTGLVEVFSPFRILDNQYVTVTKTLAGIERVWRLPLSTHGIGQPPPAPSLPSQVIQQIFTPKPILLPRSPLEQAIVTVTLIVGVMVLAIVRRIDLVKAMMLAGAILLVVGVPLMVYGLYIPVVVGIVLIGTAIGLQKART